MGACIRKRVVYDMSCKRFQFFVNVEALMAYMLLSRLSLAVGSTSSLMFWILEVQYRGLASLVVS